MGQNASKIDIIFDILIRFNFAVTLYILYNTDALVQYIKLFKIKFFKVKEYVEYVRSSKVKIDYLTFLSIRYSNFFTNLISCPICLAFWFNIISTCIFYHRTGGILLFGFNYILTCWIYTCFRNKMKQLDE